MSDRKEKVKIKTSNKFTYEQEKEREANRNAVVAIILLCLPVLICGIIGDIFDYPKLGIGIGLLIDIIAADSNTK